jgi:hypothetical protein
MIAIHLIPGLRSFLSMRSVPTEAKHERPSNFPE